MFKMRQKKFKSDVSLKKYYRLKYFYLALIIMFMFSQQVYAYINPSSGSDFFQIFWGIIVSIGYFFKTILKRFKCLFNKNNRENKDYE